MTPLRILIVEDNKDGADTLRWLVKVWGHEVRVARDGEEGLESAIQFDPDVILLDIGIPKIDGFEVARRVRQLPAFEKVLLIAVTGYGTEDDRERSREAGFDHHLVKPCDLKLLKEIIATEGVSGRSSV